MTPVGVFFICQNEDKCHFVNSTKMSRSPGSVPTLEHAAGMGQEAFSGRTATESKMEETHEREPI